MKFLLVFRCKLAEILMGYIVMHIHYMIMHIYSSTTATVPASLALSTL